MSDFTAEAKDYLSSLPKRYKLKTWIGKEIIELLSKQGDYLTIEQIQKKAQNYTKNKVGDTIFCLTERGSYYIQLIIPKNKTIPEKFLIFSSNGVN
ncbi:MAG: hypothetical protein EU535_03110 [Promethearchaeota archaeon]|nr:MAG: hypothetical protein EU535_03110 [Candidatus Lokiarchaeota archaeon]